MQDFTTPMMKQYVEIKQQYEDCLLFYRMGDFYELFMEDATIGAQVLNITLTSRAKGKDGRIPMAGVPFHAVDAYLAKLVKAGYKVAICEQMSPPNKYGIIDRQVIRIITPGTVLDEKTLDKKNNNYIISLFIDKNLLAIASSDISTGYFSVIELPAKHKEQVIRDELAPINPAECILPISLYNDPHLLSILHGQRGLNIYCFQEWDTYANQAASFLKKQFNLSTLASFGIEDKPIATQAAASLLGYLQNTQKTTVKHIKKIIIANPSETMMLDKSTMLNLELFSTIREHDTRGSLLSVLDETITAMGGRLLKQWVRNPLTSYESVSARHSGVEEFMKKRSKRNLLREKLEKITDIERILSRLSVNIGNARDVMNLKLSLTTILEVKKELADCESALVGTIQENISEEIKDVITMIEKHIVDEPPIDLRSGGIMKKGISEELDILRTRVQGSKDWILQLEQEEKEKTGIGSLKVRFNKVFGFYIEISKSNLHLVPKNYMRKQTLVNGERFITPELKEHEEIILTAEDRINDLEYQLFQKTLLQILSYIEHLQNAAYGIAMIDCLINFAHLAEKNNYIRATIVTTGTMNIHEGRHPVVEKLLEQAAFVPNNITLDKTQQLLLITGPNMAGKSVFIRQTALIVLMNQIGSFVPASQAEISLVDRIFVRSGASDVITSGLSTFMVEMVETAHILHHATEKSLIIMDEIGRGTSTYDGISIAWAVAEYLATHFKTPPKTLFATHYHELQELEKEYPNKIKNFHMQVENKHGQPIFLHTIAQGGASHSFGVAVAKLAGVPEEVVEKATNILHSLEKRPVEEKYEKGLYDNKNLHIIEQIVIKELGNIDISNITPLDALNKLAQLKNNIKLFENNLIKIID